jgi:ribosomal protein S12 methylthiotransferase accessory factor
MRVATRGTGAARSTPSRKTQSHARFAISPTSPPTTSADLNWELQRLQSVGVKRVIAIDLTRSDIGIPVVRIVTPGLEWDCTHPDYIPGARARRAGLDNQ